MTRLSKGELKIVSYLKEKGIICTPSYSYQYSDSTRRTMQFDLGFEIENKTFLIEYNGRQFNSANTIDRQTRIAKIKEKSCKDKGFPLLTINYDVPVDEIKTMIDKFISDNSKVKL